MFFRTIKNAASRSVDQPLRNARTSWMRSGFSCDDNRRCYHTSRMDYYKILGISPKSTQAEVKSAYFALSKKHHPDTKSEHACNVKFSLINDAYMTLGNVAKRREYDRKNFSFSHLDRRPPSYKTTPGVRYSGRHDQQAARHAYERSSDNDWFDDRDYQEYLKRMKEFEERVRRRPIHGFDDINRRMYEDMRRGQVNRNDEQYFYQPGRQRASYDFRISSWLPYYFIAFLIILFMFTPHPRDHDRHRRR